MKRIAFLATCIAAAAAVPARAQTTPAPADSAHAATPAAPAAPAGRVHRNPNVITAAELEGQVATDLYELVRRLRPQWLRTRGSGSNENSAGRPAWSPMVSPTGSALTSVVAVFVDGSHAGDVNELRRLQSSNVRELQFHPSADAITRWGRDYSAGVIEVTMR
ncbi:MAG: hypothetical protein ACJ8J0_13020 [Longimicrobiaceae bacterium]